MAKKPKMTVQEAVNSILDSGLGVLENSNNSDNGAGVTHLTIAGGVRLVEFYPHTLVGYANPVNNMYSGAKVSGIKAAIRLAKTGK